MVNVYWRQSKIKEKSIYPRICSAQMQSLRALTINKFFVDFLVFLFNFNFA